MGRRTQVRIMGKRASFEVEKWAHAVEALARQLHWGWQETGHYPAPPEDTEDEEPREPC